MNDNHIDVMCLLETKIRSFSPSNILDSRNFQIFKIEDSFHNFNETPNGLILVKWNAAMVSFSAFFSHFQLIHDRFTTNSTSSFLVTFVYVENINHGRKELWRLLISLVSSISEPWIILGDLNYVRNLIEKIGGQIFILSKLKDFNDCIINYGLIEMQNKGLSFSWFNQ